MYSGTKGKMGFQCKLTPEGYKTVMKFKPKKGIKKVKFAAQVAAETGISASYVRTLWSQGKK